MGVLDHRAVVEGHRRKLAHRVPAGFWGQFGRGGGGHQAQECGGDHTGVRHPVRVGEHRELFQVGRDLNAQTGNLSPLVAAGLFYLLLTIPLTHLVNFIDARLRRGREPGKEDPLELSVSQEMI